MKRSLFASTVIATSLTSALAGAADPDGKMWSAGVQTLLGGSVYSTPDNVPGGYDGLGFAGSAGGFSWGLGGYGEVRPIKYLGIAAGLGYDKISFHRNVTVNGIKTTESVTAGNMRLGFLAKGIIPGPFGRVWLGLGPEFLIPTSADASFEVNGSTQSGALISAKEAASTLLTFGLGFVFSAGPVEIPVDLRASNNLSQKADWNDRVTVNLNPASYQVTARTDWDFRLGLGIGVPF